MTEQEFLEWTKEDPTDLVSTAELAVGEIDDNKSPVYIAAESLLEAWDKFNELIVKE